MNKKENRTIKHYMLMFAILTLLLLNIGCSASKNEELDSNKIQAFTSFYVLADFTQKIGGDLVQVTNIIPPGVEPHEFEPTPKQVANIQNTDVFIYNGAGFDVWAEKLTNKLPNTTVIINSSNKISLHELEEEDNDDHDNHEHSGVDPHVWLNPINALSQAEQIKEGLIKADPENKAIYDENFNKLKQSFLELDEKYKKTLSKAKNKQIFVSHAAFGYLANQYGLQQIAISGLTPQDEPSPKEMMNIVNKAKKFHVNYILFEPLVQSKYAQTLMKEIGAKSLTLNPIGGLTKEQLGNGEDYFSIMNENLDVLKMALGVE